MSGSGSGFYIRLRKRIIHWLDAGENRTERWGKYLLAGPDLAHLLCGLMGDGDVAARDKVVLGAVLIYFFSPLDFFPELFLGPLGYLDDIALTAYALNGLINRTDAAVVRRHWAGEEDVLTVVRSILDFLDRFLGRGLWRRLRRFMR